MWGTKIIFTQISGGPTTARGPTPARHHLISGPRKKYNILHLRKKKKLKIQYTFFISRNAIS